MFTKSCKNSTVLRVLRQPLLLLPLVCFRLIIILRVINHPTIRINPKMILELILMEDYLLV